MFRPLWEGVRLGWEDSGAWKGEGKGMHSAFKAQCSCLSDSSKLDPEGMTIVLVYGLFSFFPLESEVNVTKPDTKPSSVKVKESGWVVPEFSFIKQLHESRMYKKVGTEV